MQFPNEAIQKRWHQLRAYLQLELTGLDRETLWTSFNLKGAWKVLFWWVVPAYLVVIVTFLHKGILPKVYLQAAIGEGIGPHLWNVMGVFGLILVGLSVIYPRASLISHSAYHVLTNTYSVGCLSLGLIAGQLTTIFLNSEAPTPSKLFLAGIGGALIALVAFNIILWYLAHLMIRQTQGKCLLTQLPKIDLRLRVFVALLVGGIPIVYLLFEK